MKFYSESKNLIVWEPRQKTGLRFNNGEYETDKKVEIARLKELGYRSDDDGWKTVEGDEGGQEVEEEPKKTVVQLREEAKAKGIVIGRKNRAELIAALKEGV